MVNGFGQNQYQYPPNQNNQGNFGALPPVSLPPSAIPVTDQIKSTPAGGAAAEIPTTPDEFIKAAPYYAAGTAACFAMGKGFDKLCNETGDLADSRLAKITNAIDNNNTVQKIDKVLNRWLASGKKGIKGLYDKLPQSIKEMGTEIKKGVQPVQTMARGQASGIRGQAVDAVLDQMRVLIKHGKLNVSSSELDAITKVIDQTKTLTSVQIFKEINDNILKQSGGIAKLAKNAINIEVPRKIPFIGLEIPKIKRKVNLNSFVNKLDAIELKNAKTSVSKGLQKIFNVTGESISGGFAGGKIGIAMNAAMLAISIKRTIDAPKGEKLSTFMEEMAQNIGFMAVMSLSTKPIYNPAGLSNLGMDRKIADLAAKNSKLAGKISTNLHSKTIKEGIEELTKKLLEESDVAIAKGLRKEIKALKSLSGKGLPFIQKLPKKLGNILTIGLGKEASKGAAKTVMQKVGSFAKRWGGGGMRLALFMFVVSPILVKPFTWLSHKLFGTPTPPEELEKAKEAAKNNGQTNQVAPVVAPNSNPTTAQAPAAQESNEPKRTYIPSPQPSVFQTQQNTALSSALNKTDSMTKYLEGILQGVK